MEMLTPLRDPLYRYARRGAWRGDEAGDIVQEAVMTAWREFGRFEHGTNFRAWMFKVLVNTIFRFNKRLSRRRETPLDENVVDVYTTLEREDTWSMLLHDPDKLTQLLDERLAHALDRLGPSERQCLLLRLLEGFSYREISEMMRIPLGTVMSHVHRARIKLREALAALAIERGWINEAVP